MKRLWMMVLILLAACNRQPQMLSKLPEDAVILAFGDSLTYGTGAAAGEDYPSRLAALTGRQVVNAGVPGEISAEGRQRLTALLDEQQPGLVLLIHGGNDILRNVAADETRENLKAMIADARQRNIQVAMLGVPKFGLVFLKSADFYRELAASEAVPIDLDTLPTILADNGLKSDTVHPNGQGYQKLADAVFRLLQDQGAL